MKTVGEMLKTERIRKGISLDYIENKTKTHSYYKAYTFSHDNYFTEYTLVVERA